MARQHLRRLITILLQTPAGQRREFQYYSEVIKPELKAGLPGVYEEVIINGGRLKAKPYGVNVRSNMAGNA